MTIEDDIASQIRLLGQRAEMLSDARQRGDALNALRFRARSIRTQVGVLLEMLEEVSGGPTQ